MSEIKSVNGSSEIKAVLLHLGHNMWCDYLPQDMDNGLLADHKPDTVLRSKEDLWRRAIDRMVEQKMNMLVIDIGEALIYPSHPELAIEGSWTPEKMQEEIRRLKDLGIEAIPKLNFSTTHNGWLKHYRRMVSTKEYYRVCEDVIRDTGEIFGTPRFFHIGYDEETMGHQGGWGRYEYIVVRRGALYWRDFLRCVDTVRSTGCRPWCFSDKIWHDHDRFVKYMPRDVIMCPWNCVVDEKHPEYTVTIKEMGELGFDFIPDGCTYTRKEEGIATKELKTVMDYCRANVPRKQILGFIVCPWTMCEPGVPKRKFIESMEYGGKMFARWEAGGSLEGD